MSGESPSPGDKVVVVTNSQCRYEGYFRSADNSTGTFTLSKVRSFGTEDRDAPLFCAPSARLYGSIEFKAADVNVFMLVEAQTLADPAIVSACEQKDETTEGELDFTSSRVNSPDNAVRSSHSDAASSRQGVRARPFCGDSGLGSHLEGPARHTGPHEALYHGSGEALGGYSLQSGGSSNFGAAARGHHQRNNWRTIYPRSEGSFPQRHPGVRQRPMDEFNFEEGIEEFSTLKLSTSPENSSSDEFQSDSEDTAKHANRNQGYDKEKSFFDNLSGSGDFDPRRQPQPRYRIGSGRVGDFHGTRPYNPNVETFGEETVKQLYEIRKYTPDQRSSMRPAGLSYWYHHQGGFQSNRAGGHFGSRNNNFGSRRQWPGSAFV